MTALLKRESAFIDSVRRLIVPCGDLIGEPAGPDAIIQRIADNAGPMRILDIEVWHDPPYNSKDLVLNPDFAEIMMRGPGWGSLFPAEALMTFDDFRRHRDEDYRRNKDGGADSIQEP